MTGRIQKWLLIAGVVLLGACTNADQDLLGPQTIAPEPSMLRAPAEPVETQQDDDHVDLEESSQPPSTVPGRTPNGRISRYAMAAS